jgi:hypothetical protein
MPRAEGGIMDDYFVIVPIGGLWVVTSSEIIVTRCPTRPDAIRAAVRLASRTASYGRRVQVLIEEQHTGPTVVWDSTRDSYSTV